MSYDTKYISAEFARQLTSEGIKKKCDTNLVSVLEVIHNKIYKYASDGETGITIHLDINNFSISVMQLVRNHKSGFVNMIVDHFSGLGYTVNVMYDNDIEYGETYELQISWNKN